VREACTLLMLASVGWLAATTLAGRAGAFLVAFGVWDLVYYLTLWIVLSWPESLSTWDILFLIPVPWVAPVWAPMLVASAFVGVGSRLFFAEHRRRAWRWVDVAGEVVAAALILGSFLVESSAAVEHRVPARYPVWLLWLGMALGIGCFLRVERRAGDEGS
jgi:hypothetical protein